MKALPAANAAPLTDQLARVGRYVIIDRIGAGGMGVVYRAYDPELDRKVAVKLLLPGRGSGQERLAREARAMARVSHPNVLPVHDVGSVNDQLFIAMEFVDGQTLADWLRAQPRGAQEIVTIFCGAAAGLAAAHEVGVVHRDFKPDNVLVDQKGRPQVTDFGLAAGDLARIVGTENSLDSSEATRLTREGAIVGTPAYMAPEQFAGETVDAQSDQFSFCVALWEALWGQRPIAGTTAAELGWAVTHGEIRPLPAPTPTWLHQVLVRGLSTDPGRRWPSMAALVAELEHGHARTRRRRIGYGLLGAVLVAAVLSTGAWLFQEWDIGRRVAACQDAASVMDALWGDDARQALRGAFMATGVSYAETTAEKLIPWMNQQFDVWRSTRAEVCLKANVRELWDQEIYERALWCLDERRMDIEFLLAEFQQANATTVQKSVAATASLGSSASCGDVEILQHLPALPSALSDGVARTRTLISQARTLDLVGDYRQAGELAAEACTQAERSGYAPLVAQAQSFSGYVLARLGEYEKSEEFGAKAYFTAARSGAWQTAADAATWLIFTVGYQRGRHEDGRMWARHAQMAAGFAGDVTGIRELRRMNNLATVIDDMGLHAEARALSEQGIDLGTRTLGPDHPFVASLMNNLATTSVSMGDYQRARDLHMQVLAIAERSLGANHPKYADSLNNLAVVHKSTGQYAEALPLYRQALEIRLRALGPDHPDVAQSYNNLANIHEIMGEYETALDLHERSLAIRGKTFKPDHPEIAFALNNIGLIYESMGRYEDARMTHARALVIREKALPPEHPDIAFSLMNLAMVNEATGDLVEARRLHERALKLRERALGAQHPDVADSLYGLARVCMAEQRFADAVSTIERAVAIYSAHEGFQDLEPASRFLLARALVATGGDMQRAIGEARLASDGYRVTHSKALVEVTAWLARYE